MKPVVTVLGVAACGALAGASVLVLDFVLALLTLGFVPVLPHFVLWYVGLGSFCALLVGAWRRWICRQPRWEAWPCAAGAVALLYSLPIAERVEQAVRTRAGAGVAWMAVAGALLAYWAFLFLLRRLTPQAPWQAGLLAAFAVALGLAMNRNLVTYPFEVRALVLDAGVLLGTVVLARAVHLGKPGLAAALALALLLVGPAWRMGASRWASAEPDGARVRTSPNVLLVVVDTLRLDVFRSVAYETVEGEAFRRSLGAAVWFDNAIAVAPWTAPSMGSLMTGLYPPEHGFGELDRSDLGRPVRRLAASIPTLAEVFRQSGYSTEALVTNALLHPVSGLARGFDHYRLLQGGTDKLPLLTPLARLGLVRGELYQSARMVRWRFEARLDELAAQDRPFLFWLHLMDPHRPLHRHRGLPPDPAETPQMDPEERAYRREVRYTLRELSRLFSQMERRGLWQDTTLVLLSDHGEMFPSDGHDAGALEDGKPKLSGHGHALYGELIRVPLVIRPAGGLAQSRQVDAVVSHVDLFDTLIDLLDLDFPPIGGERISLAPWLARELVELPPGRRRQYATSSANQYGPAMRALRTRQLKLIHYPGGQRRDEFYDLTADPRETVDLGTDLSPEGDPRFRQLLRLYEESWAGLRPPPTTEDAVEYDRETRKRLEALGYL